MIYLDSSALMKLVRNEDETEALREWLSARPEQQVISSELGRVEVLRAARRVGGQAPAQARALVDDLDLVALDRAVQDLACEIAGPAMRTLDALHLSSAALLGEELTEFVAYDRRLAAGARAAGLRVAAPGQQVSPHEG